MAIVTLDDTNLTNIATAIRNKGVEGTFTPSQMAGAIDGIQTGGGGKVWASGEEIGYLQQQPDSASNGRIHGVGKFIWPANKESVKVKISTTIAPYGSYTVSVNDHTILSGSNMSSSSKNDAKEVVMTYTMAGLSATFTEDTWVKIRCDGYISNNSTATVIIYNT